MIKTFINLTNGIEKLLEFNINEVSFIRIQSTTIENKDWCKLFLDLDHNFLMHLALGFECNVYDYGTNRICSKSIYQGIEIIKYCLNRYWFNIDLEIVWKRCRNGQYSTTINLKPYFDIIYNNLFIYDRNKDKIKVRNKLKYYKRFLNCNQIDLQGHSESTSHDGDYNYYFQILKQQL